MLIFIVSFPIQFKNLIRKLSEVKDDQGQRKLDPKSVLFVANFWDQVPAAEQEVIFVCKFTGTQESRGTICVQN